MNRHNKKSIWLFIFFQVIAVIIICVGSLINFHQYKIWGKPLIPQFVGYKREIEKSINVIPAYRLVQDDNLVQKHVTGICGIYPVGIVRICCGSGSFIALNLSFRIPGSIRPYFSGLRAPPLS